jgi:microcystin-dependent protein
MKRIISNTFLALTGAAMLVAGTGWSRPAAASEPFIAQISMFGGNFAPRGWAFCDGQLLSISTNTALFSLLGTTYGGDGRTTFQLPDLRGRVAVHSGSGSGPGLPRINLGQRGGANTHTLSVAQLPAHNHSATGTALMNVQSGNGNETSPVGHVLANDPREDQYSDQAPNATMNAAGISVSVTVNNTGSGQSFNIMQPFQGINYIIALVGTFPSRN